MGCSDRFYFPWVVAQLNEWLPPHRARWNGTPIDVLALGETATTPALATLAEHLSPCRITRADRRGGDLVLDFNELDVIPSGSADVLTLLRSSVYLRDGRAFLQAAARILRPGGLLLIDWSHRGERPMVRAGWPVDIVTFADEDSVTDCADAFAPFVRRLQPWWALRAPLVNYARELRRRNGRCVTTIEPFRQLACAARNNHPDTRKYSVLLMTLWQRP